ncbi:hypothetical protein K3495_g3306 [Podosphaera aphanis]|nr:hypothetical protein K3495_g3306 [Podosphaera aphanis]
MRKTAKSIGQLQAQIAEERIKNQALSLENGRLSANNEKKKVIADPNTQFSGIEAIKRAQEDATVASTSEAVSRTQRVNTAARRAEISTEHGQACSFKECLFEFEI